MRKPPSIHQGKLLEALNVWYNKGVAPFVNALGFKSSKTYYNLTKLERLQKKHITKICRALGIPESYFDGNFELPTNLPSPAPNSGEPDIKYELLKEENRQLLNEINDLKGKYIEVLEKYHKIVEEGKPFARNILE